MDQNQTNPEKTDQPTEANPSTPKKSQRWWAWPLLVVIIAGGLMAYQYYTVNRVPDGPGIPWMEDYDQAMQAASEQNKPLLVVFSSQGCPPCRQMKQTVYHDVAVVAEAGNFVPVYIDTAQKRDFANQHHVQSIPAYQIHNANGETLYSFGGYMPAEQFIAELQAGLAKAGASNENN